MVCLEYGAGVNRIYVNYFYSAGNFNSYTAIKNSISVMQLLNEVIENMETGGSSYNLDRWTFKRAH